MASNPKSPASSTGKNSVVESSVNNSSSDMIQNAEKVHDGSQSRPQSHSNRNSSQSSILRKPLPPIGSRMDVLPPNLQAVMDQLKLQTVTWISKFRDTVCATFTSFLHVNENLPLPFCPHNCASFISTMLIVREPKN